LPGLRELSLDSCQVTFIGLQHVASLRNLREFSFDRECEIEGLALAVLEALPHWTRVRCNGGYLDRAAWSAFQERRLATFDQAPAAERRKVALLFLPTVTEGQRGPFTEIGVSQTALSDAEMRFFREVPELEALSLYQPYGLTSAGLSYLSGMSNLRSVQ